MLDNRSVAVVTQSRTPCFKGRAASKTDRVRFEAIPSDDQNVSGWGLDAALNRVPQITGAGRDHCPQLLHCGFEIICSIGLDTEVCNF